MRSKAEKWGSGIFVGLCILYMILMVPAPDPPEYPAGEKNPFAWNSDKYWAYLESEFFKARSTETDSIDLQISEGFAEIEELLISMSSDSLPPASEIFSSIEDKFFNLASLVAANPTRFEFFLALYKMLRIQVKEQSRHWDMNSQQSRDTVYRILFGGRMAVEEVIMQSPPQIVNNVTVDFNEQSVTPFVEVYGVRVHSGDILVSRGGAPTSALIARGNDYPGNFSHAALVYVSETTGEASVIESLIEHGVKISTVDDYLHDTKLRIMLLRVRSDIPSMITDPWIPHKAAGYIYQKTREEHIPYDFAMDTRDGEKQFCSEVVSQSFREWGVQLWSAVSNISGSGIKNWLSAFGVRNFKTQQPSDLEYDPKLRVVVEWRDFKTLTKDRIDNAIVDVMLEDAEAGKRLQYDIYMLPIARIVKAYSFILNLFGGTGPVPEGMNSSTALRNKRFSKDHNEIKENLQPLIKQFEHDKGYSPPYWELVRLAREAKNG
ncbi:MAG: hypothetical protein HN356_00745 [Calditrichaeota bacterium]|nr:hypothetical protein [Calditrichota bacterium]MBT7619333.1 hypothetical protein [Calditrichota bacterium]MBT7788469.1 hypothetical protein [Calditrichota bacterium]